MTCQNAARPFKGQMGVAERAMKQANRELTMQMDDRVEPRREFIKENGLSVTSLDD